MAHPWLGKLLALQKIDLRLRDMKLKLAALPKEKAENQQRAAALQGEIDSAADNCRRLKLECAKKQSDIDREEAEIRRLQQQSAMVKSNDEYQAMLAQIERGKGKISDFADELLELFDQSESAEKELKRVTAENSSSLAIVNDEMAELTSFGETLAQEIAELEKASANQSTTLPPEILNRYRRLLARRDIPNPAAQYDNSGSCPVCHMKLTLQTLNLLQKSGIVECENCQGIVYDPELAGI